MMPETTGTFFLYDNKRYTPLMVERVILDLTNRRANHSMLEEIEGNFYPCTLECFTLADTDIDSKRLLDSAKIQSIKLEQLTENIYFFRDLGESK